uniref:Reverse transcriptase domain-containing protein n=1 Tax=Haemonchus contortus TaxID=6289 RepID=A0A7I4YU89_HAECO
MHHMELVGMGVKVDGWYLHHLNCADDTALIGPNIEQVERMLAELDSACGKIGLRLHLTKTMLLTADWYLILISVNGRNISECSSYGYLGQEVNVMNDLAQELCGRKRAA